MFHLKNGVDSVLGEVVQRGFSAFSHPGVETDVMVSYCKLQFEDARLSNAE